MAADDLSAPLGQETKRHHGFSAAIMASMPQAIAIALATFLGIFVLWAVIADNPFGGQPMAVVQISPPGPTAPRVIGGPAAHEAPAILAPNAPGVAESGPGATTARPKVPFRCRRGLPRRRQRAWLKVPPTRQIPEPSPSSTARPAPARKLSSRARRRRRARRPALPPRTLNRTTRNWSKRPRKGPFRKSRPTACVRRRLMRSR